jgi:hypothetical protein
MLAKTTKAAVAALVLTGVSLMFVANAAAAPTRGYSAQTTWMDRASNGGHAQGDTNGF